VLVVTIDRKPKTLISLISQSIEDPDREIFWVITYSWDASRDATSRHATSYLTRSVLVDANLERYGAIINVGSDINPEYGVDRTTELEIIPTKEQIIKAINNKF